MATVTKDLVETLSSWSTAPCVSIIVPIDLRHPDERRSHTMLKGLLASARAQLVALGASRIDDLLVPVDVVLQRSVVGEHSGSLALFLAPGFNAEVALDVPLGPTVVCGSRFAIGPLVWVLTEGHTCHVLTIGAEHVALHRVERTTWSRCDVPDLAASVDDGLWYERMERASGSHAGGPVGDRGLSIIGHGSGAQDEDRKARLSRFFHQIDAAVVRYLHDPVTPLVVAGTAANVDSYRMVSRHHRVIAAPVGSPAELTADELRQRVARVIEQSLGAPDSELLGRLGARLGTGLASTDLDEIVEAGASGRVSDLFVASIAPRWRQPGSSEQLDEWAPGATDIVDDIIGECWRQGARVHRVGSAQLPGATPLAALYRY